MKQKLSIILILIVLSNQVQVLNSAEISIQLGQFTPINFSQSSDPIVYKFDLNLQNKPDDSKMYINFQNPSLYDNLNFEITVGGQKQGQKVIQKDFRYSYNLFTNTCEKNKICQYSIEFTLKDSNNIPQENVGFVQFINYSGEKKDDEFYSYPIVQTIKIVPQGNQNYPTISQNMLAIEGAIPLGTQNMITQYNFLVKIEQNFQIQNQPYVAVSQNTNNDNQIDFQIMAKKIDDNDIDNPEKWPSVSTLFNDHFQSFNSMYALREDDGINYTSGYIAISVLATIKGINTEQDNSFIVQFGQFSSQENLEFQTDLNTNNLIFASYTKDKTLSSNTPVVANLRPKNNFSNQYAGFQAFKINTEEQFQYGGIFQGAYYINMEDQNILQDNQFVNILPDTNDIFYFVSYASMFEQDLQLQIQYKIEENTAIKNLEQTVNNEMVLDSQEPLNILFEQLYFNSQNDDIQKSLRIELPQEVDQSEVKIQYGVQNSKSIDELPNSQQFDQLPCYITNQDGSCSGSGSRILKIQDIAYENKKPKYLIVKIFTKQANIQKEIVEENNQIYNQFQTIYLTENFPTNKQEYTFKKGDLLNLGNLGIISVQNNMQKNTIACQVILGNDPNNQKTFEQKSIYHQNYHQPYPVAKITEEDFNTYCPNDDNEDCMITLYSFIFSNTVEQDEHYDIQIYFQLQNKQTKIWSTQYISNEVQPYPVIKQENSLQVFEFEYSNPQRDNIWFSISTRDFSESNEILLQDNFNGDQPILTLDDFNNKIQDQIYVYNNIIFLERHEHYKFRVYFNFKTKDKNSCFFIQAIAEADPLKRLQIDELVKDNIDLSYRPIVQFYDFFSRGEKDDTLDINIVLNGTQTVDTQTVKRTIKLEKKSNYIITGGEKSLYGQENLVQDHHMYLQNYMRFKVFLFSDPSFRSKASLKIDISTKPTNVINLKDKFIVDSNNNGLNQNNFMIKVGDIDFLDDIMLESDKKSTTLFVIYRTYKKFYQETNDVYPQFQNKQFNAQIPFKDKKVLIPIDYQDQYLLLSFYDTAQNKQTQIQIYDGKHVPSSNSLVYIIIGVVLAIIIIVVVTVVVIKKKKKQRNNSNNGIEYNQMAEQA